MRGGGVPLAPPRTPLRSTPLGGHFFFCSFRSSSLKHSAKAEPLGMSGPGCSLCGRCLWPPSACSPWLRRDDLVGAAGCERCPRLHAPLVSLCHRQRSTHGAGNERLSPLSPAGSRDRVTRGEKLCLVSVPVRKDEDAQQRGGVGKAGGSAGCSRGGGVGRTRGWPEGLAPGSPLRNHGRDGPDQGETQRRLTWMEGTENLPGDPPCPPEAALRFVRVSAICLLVTIQATFLGVWPECHSGIFAQGPFPRGPSPSPARASSGSDPGCPRPHHRQPAAGCLRPAPPRLPAPWP